MSVPPSGYGPLPYQSPQTPTGLSRPGSVLAVAIIGIIIGSLGALGLICGLPQMFVDLGPPNPAMKAMREDTVLMGIQIGATLVGGVLAIWLLISSIMALKLRPAARGGLIGYAWVTLLFTVVSWALNLTILQPRVEQAMQKAGADPLVMKAMQIGQIGGLVMGVLYIVWTLVILYVMSRPHVKAAFGADSPASSYGAGPYNPR